ncbi:DUF1643 domain-containing protein [Solidesulfovibrio alcoholivorans]|uniref:DUF1643 domain-containing protein n=1 Tax=Solidesulfovibrio alcoholivorans TaxID=81406 RepID=UPI0004980A4D|nr:DUF1643 domain-containing protein [Solidesulfovibrio alcoholivorans]
MLTNPVPYRGHAVINGSYRYLLTRSWGGDPREICWIMLNPSVADATADDPTIRRVRGFSEAWSFGGFTVVNLFAGIQTDPTKICGICDPVGPENDDYIARAARGAQRIVCAWGAGCPWPHRPKAVIGMLLGAPLYCLGTTRGGSPRHPLYVRGDQGLVPFGQAGNLGG